MRNQLRALSTAVVLCLGVTACEKSGPKASGQMSGAETELLRHVPPGMVVFGGNLFNLQRWMEDSPLGKLSAELNPPEVTAWNRCLAVTNLTMVGSASLQGGALAMRIYFKGLAMDKLAACATTAKLTATLDPDGKFLVVELLSKLGPVRAPYLAVDDGIYGMVSMGSRGVPSMATLTRADLEKDVASLASANAATDARFAAPLAQLDRRRTMWFVSSADGTPAESKLGLVSGTMSIDHGLGLDVTVELKRSDDADKVMAMFAKAKDQLDQLPAGMDELKAAVRGIGLTKVAGGLHGTMTVSDAELERIFKDLGPMMGKMMGR
jgi:hypothetical protein